MALVSIARERGKSVNRRRDSSTKYEMSSVVHYVARMAMFTGVMFFLLALAALLFMSPNEVSRGIYYFVLGLNAFVILGSIALSKFMQRSDERYAHDKKAKDPYHKGPSIDDWLEKKDGEGK